jgi:hypothetical protein
MRITNYLSRIRKYLNSGSRSRRPQKSPKRFEFEQLEDRLALSTATLAGSTLTINPDPGSVSGFHATVREILLEADATDHTKLDVLDTNTLLGKFSIASIKNVTVNVTQFDDIAVDNSNGLPFVTGTTVLLQGSLAGNSLTLKGSKALFSGETYTAGTASTLGRLDAAGVSYQFNAAIATVTDLVPDTGTLTVNAPGQAVNFTGTSGVTEQLSGLASGGGGGSSLTFAGKQNVQLQGGGTVKMNATTVDPALFGLTVVLAPGSTLNINTTPSTMATGVLTGGYDRVNLLANSGFVNILSDPTSITDVGSNSSSFASSLTSGINKDVYVTGGTLWISDAANTTTKETMTVTESTISGTGMFGNNSVVFHYSSTTPLIYTGRLAESYTVAPSHAGARFNNRIILDDMFSSGGGMTVQVDVDSGNGLDLHLINANAAAGHLIISAPGGSITPGRPIAPNGTETVSFGGGLTSDVVYQGFDFVTV